MSPRSDQAASTNPPKKTKKQSRKSAKAASRTDARIRGPGGGAKKTKETPPSWAKALSYVPKDLK